MSWLRDTFGRFGAPASKAAAPAPMQSWRKQGNEALAAGNLDEARRCYEQGALADPADAPLRLNLGFVLLEQGQFAAAAERLQQALALHRPGDDCAPHEVHYLLGRAQAAQGRHAEALASFEAAANAQPQFVEAVEEAARSAHYLNRPADAVKWLGRLVELRRTSFDRLLLAHALRASDRQAEAADLLAQVCAEDPGNAEAAGLLYGALMKLGRVPEALAETERALAIHGASARFLMNRTVALERLGRLEEALDCVEQVLAIEPANRDALVNRGTILTNMGRLPEAIAAGEAALRLLPNDPELHWYFGLTLLLAGEFQRGWKEADWRVLSSAFQGVKLEGPRWQGESLKGRAILLHAEQGFGDNIQFVRYVHVLASMAEAVYLMVAEALEPLIASRLPPNCRLLADATVLPPIDFHSPLMSVPGILGTTLDSIPAEVPYLRANLTAVQAWRGRLGSDALNVGIAWAGNPKHSNDHRRSIHPSTFRTIETDGCRFVTMQPDLREAERAFLASWPQVRDLGRELHDFADTAALLEALDLVITVDTSVAHLAGALGKPVWILLPHIPDWRWMLDRPDTPWYPTARLYRQPSRGDWTSVLARVRSDLAALARGG